MTLGSPVHATRDEGHVYVDVPELGRLYVEVRRALQESGRSVHYFWEPVRAIKVGEFTPRANQAAFEIGHKIQWTLVHGYFAHVAAIAVAKDPRADDLLDMETRLEAAQVRHKNGAGHVFAFTYFLQLARGDPYISEQFDRIWLTGALLQAGDELSRHAYFDHAPELELIYHLRNGVAHGNRFHFTRRGRARLESYPAHNRHTLGMKSSKGAWEVSEIDTRLQGECVLFDFMAAGDILSLLQSTGMYLITLGNGEPPNPG